MVNTKSCLFKGVSVFAGQPDSALPTIRGKIRRLFYQTTGTTPLHHFSIPVLSDKTNHGKCVVDFRPKPVDPSGKYPGLFLVPTCGLKLQS